MGSNHIRLYGSLKDVELVGFFDPDDVAAARVEALYGCPRLKSIEALADRADAVSIASPSAAHEEAGLFFLSKGIHCLIEKPMATTRAGCEALIAAAERAGAVLLAGHVERFNPAVQEVQALLGQGATVHAVDARRLSSHSMRVEDVDVVADLMIHDLDIVCALAGAPVESLSAAGAHTDGMTGQDHVTALLRFANGAIASVTASRITEYTVRKLDVATDRGVIAVDYMNQSVDVYRRDRLRRMDGVPQDFGEYAVETAMERIKVRRAEPLFVELTHFVDCIRNGTPPQVPGTQAMAALDLVGKILEKARKDAKWRAA